MSGNGNSSFSRSPRRAPVSGDPGHAFSDALTVSLRYISYRPRTVQETRLRLSKDFSEKIVEDTLTYLLNCGFLDDAAFALQWRNSRERRRPKGRRAIAMELRRLGVEQELIDSTLEDLDEAASARRAAEKRAARMVAQGCAEDLFRRKMGDFLSRRGFNYGTVRATVAELWTELNQA